MSSTDDNEVFDLYNKVLEAELDMGNDELMLVAAMWLKLSLYADTDKERQIAATAYAGACRNMNQIMRLKHKLGLPTTVTMAAIEARKQESIARVDAKTVTLTSAQPKGVN